MRRPPQVIHGAFPGSHGDNPGLHALIPTTFVGCDGLCVLDVWRPFRDDFGGFEIGDEVIIGSGAAVMSQGDAPIVLAEGTVVGANAVLTRSTGPWEIWAGAPARKVGERERA